MEETRARRRIEPGGGRATQKLAGKAPPFEAALPSLLRRASLKMNRASAIHERQGAARRLSCRG